MTRTLKVSERSSLLIPAVEEIARIPEEERAVLRTSLEKASADISAGRYDVLTAKSLRSEFDAIFHDNKTDAEIDMKTKRRASAAASKS
jgi:hypothetical protein